MCVHRWMAISCGFYGIGCYPHLCARLLVYIHNETLGASVALGLTEELPACALGVTETPLEQHMVE